MNPDKMWRLDHSYYSPSEGKVYVFRQKGWTARLHRIRVKDFWGESAVEPTEPFECEEREYFVSPANGTGVFYSFDEALNELLANSDPRARIVYREKDSDDRWRLA